MGAWFFFTFTCPYNALFLGSRDFWTCREKLSHVWEQAGRCTHFPGLTRCSWRSWVCAKSLQSCLTLYDSMDHQASLSMGFSRQEYWGGSLCPPPGDLSDLGIEPGKTLRPKIDQSKGQNKPLKRKFKWQINLWQRQPTSLVFNKMQIEIAGHIISPVKGTEMLGQWSRKR